jgi:protein-S-isoprenylcysteine O-methyltransferase Ste14
MLRGLSLLATLVLTVAVLGLFLSHALFARGSAAIAVQVLAALLMLWARLTFGLRSFHAGADPTAGGIVTTGPYRFIRHPIYAAILYFVWAGVASHFSALALVAGLGATAGIVVRLATEERLLVERYPEYRDYAARTRRLIPFVV